MSALVMNRTLPARCRRPVPALSQSCDRAGTGRRQRFSNVQVMTKALISLPSLALITTLALSGCSLSVGGGSSSQAQGQQTQASQAGSDSAGSAGSAQGSASASALGTAASAGQAVAGYEPGQIPPIPMISLPDLSLLTQSTGAFTPDLTRSITSQPGITVRPARCDASGSLVSGSTVLGGDGSLTTSSGSTSVTNNGDGSGTYSDSATGEAITLDGKGSGTYSRGGVSITNNGDGSGSYSDGTISITNLGDGSAIVNDATVSAKPVPKAGKVGTFPSIDAAKPVQSCGTVITLEDSVLFDFGSSELRGQASTTLTNLATVIKDSNAPKVQVQGHTDSVSDDAFNQKLSEQRAQAVSNALKSDGVAADLEAVGYGETKPVAPNENPDGSDNPAGRRLNRRVEVFVPAF